MWPSNRTNLGAAMGSFGLVTGGYTDTITSGVTVRAVRFQEIRNGVK
jgi:hypothetical protein